MQPEGKVTHVELRETIGMLSQVATHQVGQRGNQHEVEHTSMIHVFFI